MDIYINRIEHHTTRQLDAMRKEARKQALLDAWRLVGEFRNRGVMPTIGAIQHELFKLMEGA